MEVIRTYYLYRKAPMESENHKMEARLKEGNREAEETLEREVREFRLYSYETAQDQKIWKEMGNLHPTMERKLTQKKKKEDRM